MLSTLPLLPMAQLDTVGPVKACLPPYATPTAALAARSPTFFL